jgi:hypothetical protein
MTGSRNPTVIGRRALLAGMAALPIAGALTTRLSSQAQAQSSPDPLASWNDGAAKRAILEFVRETTDKASTHFVPPEARIATFDQDGTLWVEQPIYTQVLLPRSSTGGRQGQAGTG